MDSFSEEIYSSAQNAYKNKLGMKDLVEMLREVFSRRIVREISRINTPEPDLAREAYKSRYAYGKGFKAAIEYYELEQLKIIKKYGNLETEKTEGI